MDEINREDHLQDTLKDLDADNVFKDVTIVCDDGKVLKAHRIILSFMSGLFRKLFSDTPYDTISVVLMPGFPLEDLELLLKLTYTGEAQCSSQRVEDVSSLVEDLEIEAIGGGKKANSVQERPTVVDKIVAYNTDVKLSKIVEGEEANLRSLAASKKQLNEEEETSLQIYDMKTGLKTSLNSLKTWKRIVECVKKYKSYNIIAKRFGVNVDELKHWARTFREAKKRKIISEKEKQKEILKKEIEVEKLEVCKISSGQVTDNIKLEQAQESEFFYEDVKVHSDGGSVNEEMDIVIEENNRKSKGLGNGVNQLDEDNPDQPTRKEENKEETRIHEDIEVHQKDESNALSVCIVSDNKNSNNGENMKNKLYEKVENQYICKICDKQYSTVGNINMHIKRRHNDMGKTFLCDICPFAAHTSYDLNSHKKTHEPKLFNCDKCSYQTNSESVMEKHMDIKHSADSYLCDKCEYAAKSESLLYRHNLAYHSGKVYACNLCSKTFSNPDAKRNHCKSDHDDIKCSICNFKCFNRRVLRQHEVQKHRTIIRYY